MSEREPGRLRSTARSFRRVAGLWLDSWAEQGVPDDGAEQRVDWLRILPLLALHVACAAVFLVGWSPFAVLVAVLLYAVRMFAITAAYHRYFSHRAFKTSRTVQFLLALLGSTAVQRGPLWWAAHHRYHHAHSDRAEDVHSPRQQGFWWSHIGWLTSRSNHRTRIELVPDLMKFPELRFLDRFDMLVPLAFAASLYLWGTALEAWAPALGTNGPQLLVWGFFVSSVALLHGTCTINSLAHLFGSRRFQTRDDSRNNFVLALLTFGEGWHNNHHHYPASARQGFRWWELDLTWYILWALARLGLIWELKPAPARVAGTQQSPTGGLP